MLMFRPALLAFAAAILAGAQEPSNLFNSAPPDVEKALRERVTGFYQAYVDGKFRAAEQYVAEDTKDLHYNQEKTKIRGFEIIKINWDDSFQKASVVTTVQTVIQMRGQNIPAAAPMATRWKLENGQWCYYVDLTQGRQTPMGMMKPGPGTREGMNVEEMLKNPNIVLNQVKLNKEQFLLRGFEKSADTIVVTNGMPGSVTLGFQTESIAGLTFKMEKSELGPGETSRIELVYDPKDPSAKPTLKATLEIQPFNRRVIIPVVFDIPDELKKQLPKQ
jgi:uncharacterized protein YchJ